MPMVKRLSRLFTGFALLMIIQSLWADEAMNYTQKTLPNGDIQTSYSASNGSSVVSIQHKDGSVETTSTAADGSKSISIQHADGTIDTHVTPANKKM